MKKFCCVIKLLFLFALSPLAALAEDTVFTYRTPEVASDHRYDYDTAVLKLALEKTKAKWGGYELVPSKGMNFPRAIESLREEGFENPMFKDSATPKRCAELGYVPFPVDLGVVGYRLFFASGRNSRRLSAVKSLEDLKAFTMGQAHGWLDIDILKSAGFEVLTIPQYESLFPMVAAERFDLLPRGANEVLMEAVAHKRVADLELNGKVGLRYLLPRFFYTNKSSAKAAERVYEGLVIAYNDGSLLKLWEEEYGPSLRFGQIENIRFFEIENPFIKGLDPAYKRFIRPLGRIMVRKN